MLQFGFQFSLSAFVEDLRRDAQPVLLAFLANVRNTIKRSGLTAKSGRPGPYRRRSAPGEAPARQTGRLHEEMDIRPVPLAPELLINAPYAERLEFQMFRPFVRPAIEDVRREFAAGRIGL